MMKKIFTFLILITPLFIYSQTNQDGFNAGFKAGYCYEKYGCVSPIPPIASITITPIGQSEFQSGYNNGFAQGISQSQSENNNNRNNGGGAYGQLKRVELDKTAEYIQNGVERLMREIAEREKNK